MRNLHKVPVQNEGYDTVIVAAENPSVAMLKSIRMGFTVIYDAEPISEAQASELASSEKTYCLVPVMAGLLP